MQSKHRLLVFGLGRHGPHPRLVRCRPDRPCIGRIGLVCLYEWANELRMQEHHLVTKRLDLARPPMPAPARFQRHPTRGSLSQKAYQLITRKPTIHDLTALHIDPVQLECTLCNVQAICRSIHFGPSVPQVAVSKLHFGTLMPFGPGGPSCFLLGPSSPKGGRCPCHLGQQRSSEFAAAAVIRIRRRGYGAVGIREAPTVRSPSRAGFLPGSRVNDALFHHHGNVPDRSDVLRRVTSRPACLLRVIELERPSLHVYLA